VSEAAPDAPPDEEAWNAALSYLSYRVRSRRELERHLQRRGYDSEPIAAVISRCERLSLLDDLSFATAFARDRIRLRPRGLMRLESELLRKGVARAEARAGIEAALREEEVTELDLLHAAARKRWRRLSMADPAKARRRLYDHLVRSGFPRNDVQEVVRLLAEDARDSNDRGSARAG
jgi:regulatory protein